MATQGQYQDFRSQGNSYMNGTMYEHQRQRQKFIFRVYTLAFVYSLLSLIVWLLMYLIRPFAFFLVDYFFLCVTCVILSLIMVSVFVLYERLRFIKGLNFVFVILIVLFISFGLPLGLLFVQAYVFFWNIGVSYFLVILFVVIGSWLKHDLTLDVIVLFVLSILFFIASVFALSLDILGGIPYAIYIYSTFVVITVLMFVMYHAQTIDGGRYAEMRVTDYLLGSLIIYHDFIIILLALLFMSISIVGDRLSIVYFNYDEKTTTTMTTTTPAPVAP